MICGHLEYAFVVSHAEEMIAYRLMVDGYRVNIYLICKDHRSIQAKNIRVPNVLHFETSFLYTNPNAFYDWNEKVSQWSRLHRITL